MAQRHAVACVRDRGHDGPHRHFGPCLPFLGDDDFRTTPSPSAQPQAWAPKATGVEGRSEAPAPGGGPPFWLIILAAAMGWHVKPGP